MRSAALAQLVSVAVGTFVPVVPSRRTGGVYRGTPIVWDVHAHRPWAVRRVALGLTQAALADLAGVSIDTIQRMEKGLGGQVRKRERVRECVRSLERLQGGLQ